MPIKDGEDPAIAFEAIAFSSILDLNGRRLVVLSLPLPAVENARALTEAERAVSAELLEGHSYAAIARLRGTSQRTIAKQAASIFRKMGVGSRSELAALFTRIRPD